ncbi:hypothetical protein ACTXT7_006341, partial [Hymenolepis weldensis]
PEIRLRPHSALSGSSLSSFGDPAIADLLSSNSTNSSSVLSRVRRRRGQRLVLHSPETITSSINTDGVQPRRRSHLNRLYRNTVRSQVAEVSKSNISNDDGVADVRLIGYRRIVDESFEAGEMKEKSFAEHFMERDGSGKAFHGRKQQEEENRDENQLTSFENSTLAIITHGKAKKLPFFILEDASKHEKQLNRLNNSNPKKLCCINLERSCAREVSSELENRIERERSLSASQIARNFVIGPCGLEFCMASPLRCGDKQAYVYELKIKCRRIMIDTSLL